MASTYSPLLRVELQASGENATTWGDKTNVNLSTILENAIAGASAIVMGDTTYTLSVNYGSADESRSAILLVSGTNTASRNIIVPTSSKIYVVRNATAGGFPIVVKTVAGTGITVQNGSTMQVVCDGTNVITSSIANGSIVPALLSSTAAAWRMDSALGIGYAQAVVPNYAVVGMNGTSGSYTTYYTNNVQTGTISGNATAFDISSPTLPVTITTNNITRMSVNNAGATAFGSSVAAVSFAATGAITGATATLSGALVAQSLTLTGGGGAGVSGLTSNNVTTALGYTPVQQGTGIGQTANVVKIGWSGVSRLKATIDSADAGNFAMEGTANTYTQTQTVSGGAGAAVILATSGDITAVRAGGTTGVIFLGTSGKYLYNDGTTYQLPAQGLNVGGPITAGTYNGYVPYSAANPNGYIGGGSGSFAPGGLAEIGRYLDMHVDDLNEDYDARIYVNNYVGGTAGGQLVLSAALITPTCPVARVRTDTITYGSYGSISITGSTNGYAGVVMNDTGGIFMDNGSTHGFYRSNSVWMWNCDNGGNFTSTGNLTAYSDERLKSNWRPVATDFVTKLSQIKSGVYDRTDTKLTQVGVSAQSLQTLMPEAVLEKEDGMLAVAYGNAALTACIELAKEVVALRAELQALKGDAK